MIRLHRTPSGTSRYDGRVGILHVGAQDNGAGHWNWWVATEEQEYCPGENAVVAQGGSSTLGQAKIDIASACQRLVEAMQKVLQ